jgi:DNA repair protein RadC
MMYKLPIYRIALVRERSLPAKARKIQHPTEAAAILHECLASADREQFVVLC